MNLFDEIKEANANRGGNWAQAGFQGIVEVVKIEQFRTRNGHDAFTVALKVVEKEDTKTDHEIGNVISYYTDNKNEQQIFTSNIKSFLVNLLGEEIANEMNAQDFEDMIGEKQSATGAQVHLETYQKKTRAGRDFTVYKWTEVA